MTTEQIELHERFITGISGKIVYWWTGGILFIASTFWVGYLGLQQSIKDVKRDAHDEVVAVRVADKISRDSAQYLNNTAFTNIWNAIGTKPQTRYTGQVVDPVTGKRSEHDLNN